MPSNTPHTPDSVRTENSHQRVCAREVLALNIIRLRKDLGWSQEELASQAELHRTFIAHVERQVRNISLDNIEKVALALGVSVGLLLTA
jgi:transcriptional regulator with XRE-family HTH domain